MAARWELVFEVTVREELFVSWRDAGLLARYALALGSYISDKSKHLSPSLSPKSGASRPRFTSILSLSVKTNINDRRNRFPPRIS